MDATTEPTPAEILEYIQTKGVSDNKPDVHDNVGYTVPDDWCLAVMAPFRMRPSAWSDDIDKKTSKTIQTQLFPGKDILALYEPKIDTPEYHAAIAWRRSYHPKGKNCQVDYSLRYYDAEAMRHIKLWAELSSPEQPPDSIDVPSSGAELKDATTINKQPLSATARALGALTDHPEWTDQRIADAAGINRTTLYKLPMYAMARDHLRERGRADYPQQKKDKRRGRTNKSLGDTLGDT